MEACSESWRLKFWWPSLTCRALVAEPEWRSLGGEEGAHHGAAERRSRPFRVDNERALLAVTRVTPGRFRVKR